MQMWRPEFALVGISSGSWYQCLPIRTYHWLWEEGCTAVVCEAVCCVEVRSGMEEKSVQQVHVKNWPVSVFNANSQSCNVLRKNQDGSVKKFTLGILHFTTRTYISFFEWQCQAKCHKGMVQFVSKTYRVFKITVSLRKCPHDHWVTNLPTKAYLSAITLTHISQSFYLQDGGKNQLARIWNKTTSLSPQLRQLYAWEPARWQCCACGVPPVRPRCPAARDPEWGTRASSPRDRRAAWTAGARSDTCAAQRRPWSQYDFHKPDTPCTRHTHTHPFNGPLSVTTWVSW